MGRGVCPAGVLKSSRPSAPPVLSPLALIVIKTCRYQIGSPPSESKAKNSFDNGSPPVCHAAVDCTQIDVIVQAHVLAAVGCAAGSAARCRTGAEARRPPPDQACPGPRVPTRRA